MPWPPAYWRGIEAFDYGRFFEAHEHWELLWKVAPPEERALLRALIQLAAACLKIERDAYPAARRLLRRSLEGLNEGPLASRRPRAEVRLEVVELLRRLEELGEDEPFDGRGFPRLGPKG